MRQKNERHRDAADRTVKDIRRKTRIRYSSEDKIRKVLVAFHRDDRPAWLGKYIPYPTKSFRSRLLP
ncbi:MAG: hypothetical protein ABJQ71_23040 [Roseibium sp.]